MKYFITGLLAAGMLFASCKKDHTSVPDNNNLIQIGQSLLSNGKTVTLYAKEALTTGYNSLYIKISEGSKVITSESVTLSTMMDMGTMKHSSPSVNPVLNAGTGVYETGAVFTMASQAKEWSLIIHIGSEEWILKTDVSEAKTKVVGNFTATDGNVYVLALFPNKNFKVGLNDFSLIIYKKETSMKFVPASGLEVTFYPYMTSMDHGSSNNTNPSEARQGFYNGKVNFTMTGDWRFHFQIKSGAEILLDDATLDIVF